ncbi:ATP-binding cassette domain-containing protein [Cryptosporangium phraense]|uniref:ATP-binding cassette domain-containing protein n=1 Tax=Cryptosporangium phraense TaxID=2593070 RepID=A0A545AGY6_9ACTN|nr:ATP-binding cassette domain-containing protein [Cryptosporangium phraense]TQS40583.1 ATP-binding cassette domain-containing protein [Cryptosporangium phraense]
MALGSSDQTVATEHAVLSLSDVRVRLGTTVALDGLTLAVEPGEVVAVTGGPGTGKSTVFNTVCGFVRPESGVLAWHGVALRPRPHRLTTLGLTRTLQGVGLYGGLTVLENVLVGAVGVPRVPAVPPGRRAGVGAALVGGLRFPEQGPALRELAVDRLTRLGLGAYLDADLAAVPVERHGAVVLARALLAGSELLVLDDPTSGLGPDEAAALAALVREVPGGSGCAVLLTTAEDAFAKSAADRVVPLDTGD